MATNRPADDNARIGAVRKRSCSSAAPGRPPRSTDNRPAVPVDAVSVQHCFFCAKKRESRDTSLRRS
jgi:hypothetical protein